MTTDEGEADDEPVHILPTENADKLRPEKLLLIKQLHDYAPFRTQE